MSIEKEIKSVIDVAKNINKTQLQDGTNIELKVKPSFNPKKTKLGLTFTKDIKEDNVEIIVKVNGEVNTFLSGVNNSNFTCEFSATKRF